MAAILLVNDERILRTLIGVALRRRHHQVYEAASAAGARRQVHRLHRDPDLLLAEVSLPGASGLELAAQLTAEHPGMRTLLLSRHPHRGQLQRRAREEGWEVIEGAFPMEELVSATERVLKMAPPGSRKPPGSETTGGSAPGKAAANGGSSG